jgi:hypothetical protein
VAVGTGGTTESGRDGLTLGLAIGGLVLGALALANSLRGRRS